MVAVLLLHSGHGACQLTLLLLTSALQALDRRIAEALDCPCVEDLKSGPCGELFVNTFTCYQKSRAEPKGCDCLDVSLAFAVSGSYAGCWAKHAWVRQSREAERRYHHQQLYHGFSTSLAVRKSAQVHVLSCNAAAIAAVGSSVASNWRMAVLLLLLTQAAQPIPKVLFSHNSPVRYVCCFLLQDCLRKHPEVLEDLQSDKTGGSLQLS